MLEVGDLFDAVAARVALAPYDLEVSEKTGVPRWRTHLNLFSTNFARAGFLRRQRGRWKILPEGRAVLTLPAEELYLRAEQAYQAWLDVQDAEKKHGVASAGKDAGPEAGADSRSEIEGLVRAMSPFGFQDLVAGVLRSLGYTIPFVASRGVADGGTDILAYPDPLGAQTPHIRVQVKHRVDKAKREEVAALRGIIRHGREIGLFVSSGGFTSDAVREARSGAAHIELMDLDGLLDKWLGHSGANRRRASGA